MAKIPRRCRACLITVQLAPLDRTRYYAALRKGTAPASQNRQSFTCLPRIRGRQTHAAVPALDARDAERIGGCRILGLLGTGGMGVVYAAVQEQPHRLAVRWATVCGVKVGMTTPKCYC